LIAGPVADFNPRGHIERKLAKPSGIDCRVRAFKPVFTEAFKISVEPLQGFFTMMFDKRADSLREKHVNFASGAELGCQPLELPLDSFSLFIFQHVRKKGYRRAQPAESNPCLMEALGVAGGYRWHIGDELMKTATRNDLKCGPCVAFGSNRRRDRFDRPRR